MHAKLLVPMESPTTVETPPLGAEDAGAEPSAAARRRLIWTIAGIVIGGLLLVGIGLLASERSAAESEWAGTVLASPQAKPEIVLTDTSGQPYDLRAETAGTTTILMFGYTSCPDVCPINLASLDGALDELGDNRSNGVRVVFVTVDPERDTPEVLRRYLDQFDSNFIGLTGTPEEIRAAQAAADVPGAVRDPQTTPDGYTVGHASQLIAYQPDGQARIVYPFGTRQSDWTRDLRRLLTGEQPS